MPRAIHLEDWYDNREAAEVLSRNSGRPISVNYPRKLAINHLIRSKNFGVVGKLYLKKDVDGYIVDTKRGPKPKLKKQEAKSA